MSTVWLAERADGQLSRQVALKLPHAGPGHEMLARRLLRERSILAGLEHRHIARLYDVGVTASGVPYLVMEHVEGEPLTLHAGRGRLPLPQRLALMRQVLAAVQYAHGKLVLHRDLKPDNILVRADGEVKLLDFGIAKILASTDGTPGATELTQAAGRRLTPAYASPEQLRGEPLGTASDVYSLGVVLYELLCGRRPFDHAGASAAAGRAGRAHARNRARSRAPSYAAARGSERAPPASRPGARRLAGDLNAVVLKALARDPARRYASVEALDADLARWLAGRPVAAHPPSKAYAFAKFASRHPLVARARHARARDPRDRERHRRDPGPHRAPGGGARGLGAGLPARDVRADRSRQAGRTGHQRPHPAGERPRARDEGARRHAGPQGRAAALHREVAGQSVRPPRGRPDAVAGRSADLRTGRRRARAMGGAARSRRQPAGHGPHRRGGRGAEDRCAHPASSPTRTTWPAMASLLRDQAFVAGFRHDWATEKEHLQRYLALTEGQAGVPPRERVEALLNFATACARSDDLPGALARIAQAFEELRSHPEIPDVARLDVVNYRQDIDYQWGRYADIARRAPDEIRECDQRLHALSFVCVGLRSRLQAARLRLGQFDEAHWHWTTASRPCSIPRRPRDRIWGLSARTQALRRAPGSSTPIPSRFEELRADGGLGRRGCALDPNYRLLAYNTLAEARVLAQRPGDARPWLAPPRRR